MRRPSSDLLNCKWWCPCESPGESVDPRSRVEFTPNTCYVLDFSLCRKRFKLFVYPYRKSIILLQKKITYPSRTSNGYSSYSNYTDAISIVYSKPTTSNSLVVPDSLSSPSFNRGPESLGTGRTHRNGCTVSILRPSWSP